MTEAHVNAPVYVIGTKRNPDISCDSLMVDCVDLRDTYPEGSSEVPDWNGFLAQEDWQDPYSGRAMTVGEFGCAASHVAAWERAAHTPAPTIVLEEDARLQVTVEALMEVYDECPVGVTYLAQQHYGSRGLPHGRLLHRVTRHPYWTLAYIITPTAAQQFLAAMKRHPLGTNRLIPADEMMPALMGLHGNAEMNRLYQTDVQCYSTHSRYFNNPAGSGGSTTERGPYIAQDPGFTTLTVATDEEHPGYQRLRRSAERYGHRLVNVGAGVDWEGGDMDAGPGGGHKMLLVRDYLENDALDAGPYLFVDGYDTIIQAHASDLLAYWNRVTDGTKVLVAGESTCWPQMEIAPKFPKAGPCPYPNSGMYMGTGYDLLRMLPMPDTFNARLDDQCYLQQKVLAYEERFIIDVNQRVFCCLNHNPEELTVDHGRGQLVVGGDRWPYIVHANGPPWTKERLDENGDLAAIGGRIRAYYGRIEE